MNKFKFTGENIAAALLILAYFFPWVGIGISGFGFSYSGWDITTSGQGISGLSRFLMVLALLVPASAALILYQNVSGNLKLSKYFKLAHIIPAVYILGGIIMLYFKMKPDAATTEAMNSYDQMMPGMRNTMAELTPSIFDILRFGIYLSLIASVYLLLVSMGTVKDKEYYKPAVAPAENKPTNEQQ